MGMNEFALHIHRSIIIEDAWQKLDNAGCELLYSIEEADGTKQIFGRLPANIDIHTFLLQYPFVTTISPTPFGDIDWETQWALHGSDYREGYVHVDLRNYKHENNKCLPQVLRLRPGPGFGDLSHPTTRLVLKMMATNVKSEHVLDVGCGSGILSLASIAMGAKSAIGIDIDLQALIHAESNSELNKMEHVIQFVTPENLRPKKNIKNFAMLMNMIQSEQVEAWNSLSTIHSRVSTIITSGILTEEREAYLKLCQTWKWHLIEEIEESGWLAFIHKCKGA